MLILFLASPIPALALEKEREPVIVKADQVDYIDSAKKVIATGHVEAVYKDMKVTCDEATIYTETKDAYLKGRVRLVQIDGLLKGGEILYNFETQKGTILDSEVEAGPWRASGARAEKISSDSVLNQDGYLTSCDFEDPHTKVRAKTIQVYLGDKVVLKNAVIYVGHMPLIYLPSYTHLLDDKRPRVTITPGNKKDWGLFLLTSWRIYFNENLQGRLHIDYRERRDLATGLDLKYRLPVGGKGVFREYYMNERLFSQSHQWDRLIDPDKSKPTTEKERFRVQVRHVWDLDDFTKATVEYNRAKDPTFIHDYFEQEYDENTASPLSYFQVIRTSTWYGLTFLMNKRTNRFDSVTEQLPFVRLDLRPLKLDWLPTLDWFKPFRPGMSSGYKNPSGWFYQSAYSFERSNAAKPLLGTEAGLTTLDTTQELFYPMRVFKSVNLRPFFQFRETAFSQTLNDTGAKTRQAFTSGFDMNTKFFRVFPWDITGYGLDIHRIRHVLTPNLRYEYRSNPTITPNELIRSDGFGKSNIVTPGLEQKLQTKRQVGTRSSTVDLARLLTSMPFDIEGLNGSGSEWDPLRIDLETLPYPWLRFETDADLDPHIGQWTAINFDIVAHPVFENAWKGTTIGETVNQETGEIKEFPWSVGAGWRYQREISTQLTLETAFDLNKKWRIGIYNIFDLKRFETETRDGSNRLVKQVNNFSEIEYRLRRDLHEWWAELVYSHRRQGGDSFLLLFRLKDAPELPFSLQRSYHQPKTRRN